LNESGVVTGLALPGPNVVELLWLAQVSKPQSFQIRLELQSKDAKSVLLSFEDLVTETELRLGKPLSTRSFRFSFPESHPVPLWWQSSKVATVSDPKCRLAGFGRLVSCRTGLRSWSHRFENSGQSLWLKTLQ